MKKQYLLGAMIISIFALASPANAITIDGKEYSTFLSAKTSEGGFGFWKAMQKYYTSSANSFSKPTGLLVDSVEHVASGLVNYDFHQISIMGTTRHGKWSDTVKTGSLRINDSNGNDLLTAEYLPYSGTLVATSKRGPAGQANLTGLFAVTGGSLADSGLISGKIHAQLLFTNGLSVWKNDFAANFGTITLSGNLPDVPTEVPEPMTAAFLLSGLL